MPKFYSLLFCFVVALASFSQSESNIQNASHYLFRNSDSAFYFSNKTISEAKDSSSYYYGKFLLGQCIFWQGHIDSSISYYNETENYFIRQKDSVTLMKVYLEKGNTLKVLSLYDKSYDYLMKSLRIAHSMDSLRWQALITIHLAEHARAMGNKENAGMYIDRAFNIHNLSPLKEEDLAELYHRKAAIEQEFGNSEKAVEFSFMSLKLSESSGNLHQQATSYNELGFYYGGHSQTGEDKTLKYYSMAEEIWKKMNFKRYYIWVWRNISIEYRRKKQYEQSNQLLKQILSVSKPNQWDEVSADVAQLAAFNYEALKNADSALAYFKKFISYRANAEAKVKSKEFQDMVVKYATKEKEEQLKAQEEETALAKEAGEKTAIQRNFILILLVVLLTFFGVIVYLTLKLGKKNMLLSEGSIKIADVNRKLQSELNQKNILFAELHHRVKNNLAILSGLINLQKDAVTDPASKEILVDTQTRIHSIAMIHRTLYSMNDSEDIDFSKYLKELSQSLIDTYKKQKVECVIDLPGISININKGVPLALILNELLSNSLKHAFQNKDRGRIIINGNMENELFHLHYYDDGPGFKADFTNLPTSSQGLQLIKILSEQLDAEFHYQYRTGNSEFTFLIPVKK